MEKGFGEGPRNKEVRCFMLSGLPKGISLLQVRSWHRIMSYSWQSHKASPQLLLSPVITPPPQMPATYAMPNGATWKPSSDEASMPPRWL